MPRLAQVAELERAPEQPKIAPPPKRAAQALRYYAFLSYSRDQTMAAWLQEQLERFWVAQGAGRKDHGQRPHSAATRADLP